MTARRKTVSITINEDLAAKASAAGVNISRAAEEAVAAALRARERELVRAEFREASDFLSSYLAQHGPPFGEWMIGGEVIDESGADDAR